MATYDESGNTVYPTADPNIVKEHLQPGQTPPMYATTVPDGQGGEWAYYPTQTALRAGKVIAALDTISALPEQITDQIGSAVDAAREVTKSVPTILLIAGGLFVAFEVFMRRTGR